MLVAAAKEWFISYSFPSSFEVDLIFLDLSPRNIDLILLFFS